MRTITTSIPFAGLVMLASCGGAEHEHHEPMAAIHNEMMMADSVAKAQEATVVAINDLFNGTETEGLENVMTADFLDHQMDPSIKSTGIQSVKELLAMYHTAFPDIKQEIISMATKGDKTYFHVRITGTNTGPWGEMPATGKAIDVMGCDVIRFENGKAAEHWGYMEDMKMMTQLGLMPAPPDAEAMN